MDASPDAAPVPRLPDLVFHGPLSEERAARIVARLAAIGPATVLDIGCGWGELLLRVLAAAPGAHGIGVDLDAGDLARGRALAAERGLSGRVRYVEESARGTRRGPADVVLCNGAGQALADPGLPGYPRALFEALRSLVKPGGRVLLGEGFFRRVPTGAELSRMWPGATAQDHPSLGALVDTALAAGLRPLWTETASESEWEDFESGHRSAREEWLALHPGHPRAAEIAEQVDTRRDAWLHGYRDILGLAYLTLVPTG